MVRKYIRKINKCSWNETDMQLAINHVFNGHSCKFSAEKFGVPRSSLQKKILQIHGNNNKKEVEKSVYHRIFTETQEKALANYILEMEEKLLGLTGKDIRQIAFQFAEKLQIRHNFNRSKGLAGKDWLSNFMSRHDFAHRKPEHTSSARANGFNEAAVEEFFNLLENLMEKYKFTADRIYNVDETGISVVPKKSPKIVAKRGRKQIGGLVAAERGETVTAEICMSAGGQFMPPMLIFPRVKVQPLYLKDMPPGAWAEFHKTGYMQTDIFTRWFNKFIEFSRASIENPVLLLLDGHATHVKNLDTIDLAKKNGVEICFPPHCTHKMQPCDTNFNDPLSHYFGEEVTRLQKLKMKVTMYNLFSVFGKAFIRSAKMETAINAFKSTGIYPCNKEMFLSKHFKTVNENCNNSNHSKDSDSNARIEHFANIIHEIIGSKNEVYTTEYKNTLTKNNESISSKQHTEIKIPFDYVLQAALLINHLSSCLRPHLNAIPEQEKQRNLVSSKNLINDFPVCEIDANPNISTDSFVNSEITHEEKNTEKNTLASEAVLGFIENVPVVPKNKGKRKGKAAIITSEEYQKNLIEEKIKNIKKEKNDTAINNIKGKKITAATNKKTKNVRSKPVITSELILEKPADILNIKKVQPRKPRQSNEIGSASKRPALSVLDNNINYNNIILQTSEQNLPLSSISTLPLINNNILQITNLPDYFINSLPIEIIP